MRIGIEAQRIFRLEKHGMDIYAQEIIQTLAKQNPSIAFVIFIRKDINKTLKEYANLKIVEIPAFSYVDFEQIWLPLAIRREKLDFMHFTSNTAPLFCSVPYIVTVHDIMYLKGPTGGTFYQKMGHYYRKWIVPQIIKRAARIITVSEYEKKSIIDTLHLASDFVDVVYNGVADIFTAKPGNDSNPFCLFRALPNKFILFLGNEAPKKNMNRFLQAYAAYTKKENEPIPLVLVETSNEQLNHVLKELQIEFIRPKIFLTGYVSQPKLAKLYRLATLFVYPSLQESFGIPLIEAMASGTPVITSDTTALPEIAGNAAWLIDPLDVKQMSEVITVLLSDKVRYNQLQKKGRQRANVFTWSEAAKQTFQIYLSAIQ